MTRPPRKNVVDLPVGSVIAPMEKRIRDLAKETKNIFLSDHAQERMWERDISDAEVFQVLRVGSIAGIPWREPETGERACKVVLRRRGSRAIGVVTILLTEDGLLVKTVEWENER